MSVINRMLRDLDQRRQPSGLEAKADETRPSIKVVPQAESNRSRWMVGAGALLLALLVLLAMAGWLQTRRTAGPDKASIVQAPPVPVLPPSAAAASLPAALPAPLPRTPDRAAASTPTPNPTPPLVAQAAVAAAPAAAPPVARPMPPKPGPALKLDRLEKVEKPAKSRAPPLLAAAPAPPPTAAETVLPTPTPPPPPKPSARTSSPPAAAPPQPAAAPSNSTGGKTYSTRQLADNLFGEALALDRQGRPEEAKQPLLRLLAADPLDVQARRLLVQLQLDTGRIDEAQALLLEGQRLLPAQPGFTWMLARLKVDGGDVPGALRLLEAGRASARDEPQYHALWAALLLRVQRYNEAIEHYLVALRSDPANAQWLVGAGAAFEGAGKPADAAEAYRRAEAAPALSADLARFVSERLARLQR